MSTSRADTLKEAVLTVHRLSRGLDRRHRLAMFLTVTRYVQEDEGMDFSDILNTLQDAMNQLSTKKVLFNERVDEWLDQLRIWVQTYDSKREMNGYFFIPCHFVRNWLKENQINEEAALDALRLSDKLFSHDEGGVTRYSKKIRMNGNLLRCMGFQADWVQEDDGEEVSG